MFHLKKREMYLQHIIAHATRLHTPKTRFFTLYKINSHPRMRHAKNCGKNSIFASLRSGEDEVQT